MFQIKLGGARFRALRFETRRSGEALTCPPRTVGLACMALGQGDGGLRAIGDREAFQACTLGPRVPTSPEAAKEKIVLCNRLGETYVYQADRQNQAAALCACGNATGAAAALLAFFQSDSKLRQHVHLPEGRLEMRARLSPAGDGGWKVEQSWGNIQFHIQQTTLLGRQAAIATGTFNNYIFLLAPEKERNRFDLDLVLALWAEARSYGFDNPLRSRLAAIFPGDTRPYAKFYTCGRAHPGAPLTGLAALAMAAQQVDWLAPVRNAGHIEHRRGVDALPIVRDAAIDFPAIHARLDGIGAALPLAA